MLKFSYVRMPYLQVPRESEFNSYVLYRHLEFTFSCCI